MTIEPRAQPEHPTQLTLTARRGEAAPGGSVALCCRIHSRSPETIAGAMLRFVLPPEVIVAASDPAGMILAPLESGAVRTITCDVTIHRAIADGAMLRFEAALTLADGRMHRSNVAALCVRNRARLNGPGTFLRIVQTDTPHELLVEAHIVNDGSASARSVTIDVPPPAGTHPVDPHLPTACTFDQLEPGSARTFAYRVRIAASNLRSVRATDASLCDRAGNRIALAPSPRFPLPFALSTPELCATRERRRLRVTVCGTNAGSGSARAVEFALRWPAEFNGDAASLTWNAARVAGFDCYDAFARAHVRAGGADIAIASIDGGEAYELAFELEATAVARAGTLAVDLRADNFTTHIEAALHWSPRTDIRLRMLDAPDEGVDTGTPARMVVELFNAGDNDSTITLDVHGGLAQLAIEDVLVANGAPIALAAGNRAHVTVAIVVPPEFSDGETFALALLVRVDDQEVARAALVVRARDRVWIDTHEWLTMEDGTGVVALGNTGTTIARNAALVCADGGRIDVGDITPGTTRRLRLSDVDCARVARGSSLTLDDRHLLCLEAGGPEVGLPAGLDAIVRVPGRVRAGAKFGVSLHVACGQSTRRLTIRVQALETMLAVAGSLTVDNRPAGDAAGPPAIYAPGGLVLEAIPAGAHIDLRWMVQASATDATGLRIRVDLDADGAAKNAFSQMLTIDASSIAAAGVGVGLSQAAPMGQEPRRWGDASVGASPFADERTAAALRPRSASDAAVTLFLTLDRAQIDACIERLSDAAMPGMFSHICSLRGLFPTGARGGDEAVSAALQIAREAFERLLDRLTLKLRMPHFVPTIRDCVDEPFRRSLHGLLAACALSITDDLPVYDDDAAVGAPTIEVTVDPQWAQQQMTRLANAAFGDPAAVGSIVATVPVAANRFGVHLALERYAQSLRAAFDDSSGSSAEAARGTLDARRRRLVDALVDVRRELPG